MEHLERVVTAVEGLLARRGSRVSLLDIRLLPADVALRHDYEQEASAWQERVFTAITSGALLDEAIPETPEASPARGALYELLDMLRYEEDLDLLRDAWHGIRGELRRYVLGLVRDDDPDDLEALDRALFACNIRPLAKPEPRAAASALRMVLHALLGAPETHRERVLLRHGLSSVRSWGSPPRQGRYLLARFLAEREVIVVGTVPDAQSAEARAHLADPHPDRPPRFPADLVGPALLFLAVLDVQETREAPDEPWTGRSAYNVLRMVAGEARWPAEFRSTMEEVLAAVVPPDDELLRLARDAMRPSDLPVVLRREAIAEEGNRPVDEAGAPATPSSVRPCDLRALAQYERALELRPDLVTSGAGLKEIYAVVREVVHDRELDGELAVFSTWRRYLNRARHDPEVPKRSPRAGREGRSVVRRDQL